MRAAPPLLLLALAVGAAACDSYWPRDRTMYCGDGVIDQSERCDGDALNGKGCEDFDFAGGTLGCRPGCQQFEFQGCHKCGDGVINGPELCDGADLGSKTCKSVGYQGGELACQLDCKMHDVSGCFKCGDGDVNGSEVCDGADLAGQTCRARKFEGGTIGCSADCKALDTSGCYKCGDGKITGTDKCDGADLGGANCKAFGFEGGLIKCTGDCQWYDFSGCFKCGDGKVTGTDKCDGKDFGSATCASQGYYAGALSCKSDCSAVDVSACTHHVTEAVTTFGGEALDIIKAIAVDGSGNRYVTGEIRKTVTIGSATYTSTSKEDGFVAKLSSSGKVEWLLQIKGTDRSTGKAIARDGVGNLYVTGMFKGTIYAGAQTLKASSSKKATFVLKIDSSGKVIWASGASGSGDTVSLGMAADGAGNVFVTGHFVGKAKFGSTTVTSGIFADDMYLTKLNSSGQFLWVRAGGGLFADSGKALATDSSGNVFLTGYFSGSFKIGGLTMDGAGLLALFVAKVDTSGNFLWAFSAGGGIETGGAAIAVDASGNTFVTGDFEGSAKFGTKKLTAVGDDDVFVVKLDNKGKLLWVLQGGDAGLDRGADIAVGGTGNVYVMGHFEGNPAFGNQTVSSLGGDDLFLVKLSSAGQVLWADSFGGPGNDIPGGLVVSSAGAYHLAGAFSGAANLAGSSATSNGDRDAFLVRLKGAP